ncbi:helix-turn-helix domain-containing protein [Aureitalea sp. L0-47]|uniref:helix-turn-helix domain-containing protein n=1 Tax=Aureitalea sp. L0-47 TaxID=2816962 RepID=UPI002237629C|nr:helix-turn-helix domain-containing protein [Aureitalea sp. L0-47]
MGWYHAFKNTKINYWLIPMVLALAPLLFFYVKSITQSAFKFRQRDLLHFVPATLVILYRVTIYAYDASQSGFADTQNGYLKIHVDEPIFQPLLIFTEFAVMLLYLAFTFQLYYNYRKKIKYYFSNTYKYELNWILTFLLIFTSLFLYESFQDIIGALIVELSYTQRWWLNLFMAIATIYIGVMGYFTDTSKLNTLNFDFTPQPIQKPETENEKLVSSSEIAKLQELMSTEKPFLNPELNLVDLAKLSEMSRAQLSQVINAGFNKNFNDFVNSYRIEAVKDQLALGKHKELSLLGIAFDCGFNSKATFNRVFKKLTNTSPSEYLKSL